MLVDVPLVGNVAAGEPILAEENITDTITLPTDIVGDAPSFLLSVRGESMIEAGINDGDYVVVKEQPVANNGDIVVAILDDGATVKRFYKEKDHIRLQPENSSMDPILTTARSSRRTAPSRARSWRSSGAYRAYSLNRWAESGGAYSVRRVPSSSCSSDTIWQRLCACATRSPRL